MNGDSPAREPNSTSAATNALCSCKRPRRQVAAPGAHKRRHRLQQHAASRAVHRVHHLPRSKTSRSPALYTVKPLFVSALFEILSATEKHPRAATLVASRGGSTNDPVRSRNGDVRVRDRKNAAGFRSRTRFMSRVLRLARAREYTRRSGSTLTPPFRERRGVSDHSTSDRTVSAETQAVPGTARALAAVEPAAAARMKKKGRVTLFFFRRA